MGELTPETLGPVIRGMILQAAAADVASARIAPLPASRGAEASAANRWGGPWPSLGHDGHVAT